MDPATPQGAETSHDVTSAANAISGLLGAKPEGEATQKPETTETPTPTDGEQREAQDVETTEETQATEEKTETTDTHEIQLESLDELAEATELGLEKILNLKTKVKVDGKESYVPLSEALKSYQLSSHVNNQSQELANKRKAFEEEVSAKSAELDNTLQVAQGLITNVENQLLEDFNKINWDELKNDDAKYVRVRQEYNDRYNSIQAMKQEVAQGIEKNRQELTAKQAKALESLQKEESQKLVEAIDEWKDENKAKSGKEQVSSYLKGLGFSNEQIGSVLDHRVIVMARKAMLYDQGKLTADTKKVVPVKKVLTSKGVKSNSKTEMEKQLRQRLQKTGRVEDAAALILQGIKK